MKGWWGALLVGSGMAGGLMLAQAPAPADTPQGATLFQQKGCAYCHGAGASGTAKAPSLQGLGRTWDQEKIARQIREGGAAMPAFGESLEPRELEALARYVVSIKEIIPKHPSTKGAGK